jgi:hypothetical protein
VIGRRPPFCFFDRFGVFEREPTPCEGRLVRCHLLPVQLLKRHHVYDPDDDRAWVWGCGGLMGASGHHGMFDYAKTIRIPRSAIPSKTEALAYEVGLIWYLDRTYGKR